MINILCFLMILISGNMNQIIKAEPQMPACLTESRILKPAMKWQVIKRDVVKNENSFSVNLQLHDPSDKANPNKISAEMLIGVKTLDDDNPMLLVLIYYNDKTQVLFSRIFTPKKVYIGNQTQAIPMPTLCFSREVKQIN